MKLTKVAVPVLLIFILIGGSALTHFVANKSSYIPNDELYVQYSDEDIKRMQLLYRIDELNNYTLDEVFEDMPHEIYDFTLPNNVVSDFSIHDDKTFYVQSVKKYTLQASDITLKTSIKTNFDFIQFNNPSVYIDSETLDMYISGYQQTTTNVLFINDDINFVNKFDNRTSGSSVTLGIAKGTYTTLAEAKADLAGTDIYYQLATPIEIEILNIDTLTIEQLNYYYQMYLDILDGKRIINQALGTVDMNGRDYYHLDVNDYSNIGINVQQGYQSVLNPDGATMKTLGLLSTIANFLVSTIGNILDFIEESINSYEGGFWGGILESFDDLQIPWLGGT